MTLALPSLRVLYFSYASRPPLSLRPHGSRRAGRSRRALPPGTELRRYPLRRALQLRARRLYLPEHSPGAHAFDRLLRKRAPLDRGPARPVGQHAPFLRRDRLRPSVVLVALQRELVARRVAALRAQPQRNLELRRDVEDRVRRPALRHHGFSAHLARKRRRLHADENEESDHAEHDRTQYPFGGKGRRTGHRTAPVPVHVFRRRRPSFDGTEDVRTNSAQRRRSRRREKLLPGRLADRRAVLQRQADHGGAAHVRRAHHRRDPARHPGRYGFGGR